MSETPLVLIDSQTGEPEFGYTVKLEYKPTSRFDVVPWSASVSVRGRDITTKWGATREEALDEVRHWIKLQQAPPGPETVYLDAKGDPVPTSSRV